MLGSGYLLKLYQHQSRLIFLCLRFLVLWRIRQICSACTDFAWNSRAAAASTYDTEKGALVETICERGICGSVPTAIRYPTSTLGSVIMYLGLAAPSPSLRRRFLTTSRSTLPSPTRSRTPRPMRTTGRGSATWIQNHQLEEHECSMAVSFTSALMSRGLSYDHLM